MEEINKNHYERYHLFKRIRITGNDGNKIRERYEEYNLAYPSFKLLQNEQTGHIFLKNENFYKDEEDIKKNFPRDIVFLDFTKPSQIPSYENLPKQPGCFQNIIIRRDLNEEEIQKVVNALHGF